MSGGFYLKHCYSGMLGHNPVPDSLWAARKRFRNSIRHARQAKWRSEASEFASELEGKTDHEEVMSTYFVLILSQNILVVIFYLVFRENGNGKLNIIAFFSFPNEWFSNF